VNDTPTPALPQVPALFKVLNADRTPFWGGSGQWPVEGEWLEVKGPLEPCANGLHVCHGEEQLLHWLGPAIWTVEVDGEQIEHNADTPKLVVRRARLVQRVEAWTERTARLFAADCAERSLRYYEREYPNDQRPRQAITVARRFANGQATTNELDTAWAAAWAAAGAAAGAAARAAAGAAAWAAAGAAAWAAAGDAAGAAAWAAAWAAAGAAAWAAARDDERAWQANRLRQYLNGEAAR
jgi:hypothetical protein